MNATFTDADMQANAELESLFAGSAEMSQEQVVKLARVYLDARRRHEEADMAIKKLAEQRQKAESDLVIAMESAGVKGLKVDHDGSTVGISQTKSVYYSLPSGSLDDAEIMAWIKTAGGADLVKSTIHHSSFSSFCREIVSQEQALHPSVKVAEKRGVQVRQG